MLNFYKGKTVLVTGHTGFKGSWLSEILLEAGANVIGYSLVPPTKPSLFEQVCLEKRMVSIVGDIRDFGHILKVVEQYKPEIVFHLAAQPIVLTGYTEPRYTYETNVLGTVNILEAVRQADCVKSFLNVTTDKVYLNDDVPNHPFKESEPLDGFDPYSNSKSCSELATHSYKKCFFRDTPTAISTARAGNVIGGGDYSPNRIIPDCIRAVEARKVIEVRNRNSTRPYQFVLEPLFVYLLIAQKQYEDHHFEGYYNVGPDLDDAITTGALVSLFCEAWGEGAKWEDHTILNAPHEAGFLALDNHLLKNTFGWKPVYHVGQAIHETVEFSKEVSRDKSDCVQSIMKNQILKFSQEFLKK